MIAALRNLTDQLLGRGAAAITVPIFDGALKLLGFFVLDHREWRVTEPAQRAGLHKSQVSRILRTSEA